MASIFSLDKQVASLPKHGFPMSEPFTFTSSCGHLLPIYFDQLNPGEKFRYRVDLFTRTQPLAAPAMCDIDEFIDVFFVPLQKISSAAENILFQISDLPSSSLPSISTDVVLPLLDLSKIGVDIAGGASNTYLGTYGTGITELGSYGVYFESYVAGMIRLFDHCQVDPTVLYQDQTGIQAPYRPMINPAIFACYQAIFYDYYRLSNWKDNKVYAYNLDSGYNGLDLLATGLPWATSFGLRELLQLRYRSWYKDYFTNVFPSALIGSAGMLPTNPANLTTVNQWLVDGGYITINPDASVGNTAPGNTTVTYGLGGNSLALLNRANSTASIRTLFAVDKLMKITARAGKHYDDQVLAHFGFKVPKGYSKEVVHLGTHHQQIHIGEVISTADTTSGALGELAGKGYGKAANQIVDSFVAPCHGYVMAIYSCVPKVAYIGGLSKLHAMTKRYDWFIPELDNLGMQPLFAYELNMLATTPTTRAAWQIRNAQMKSKFPRATYAFKSRGDVQGNVYNDGPFAEWLITDFYPFSGPSFQTIPYARLLVSPCMLNQLTLASYLPTPAGNSLYLSDNTPNVGAIYSTDPLIHHCVQSVSKISGMSVYGLDDKAI